MSGATAVLNGRRYTSQDPCTPPGFVSVADLARLVGVGRTRLDRYVNAGLIPVVAGGSSGFPFVMSVRVAAAAMVWLTVRKHRALLADQVSVDQILEAVDAGGGVWVWSPGRWVRWDGAVPAGFVTLVDVGLFAACLAGLNGEG